MKNTLLGLIKLYWLVFPQNKKRTCLFSKSCSNYVFDETQEKGLVAGIKALKYRVKNCNSKHEVVFLNEEKRYLLKLSNGDFLQHDEIAPIIIWQHVGMEFKAQ